MRRSKCVPLSRPGSASKLAAKVSRPCGGWHLITTCVNNTGNEPFVCVGIVTRRRKVGGHENNQLVVGSAFLGFGRDISTMAVVIIDMQMAGQSAVTYRWLPVNQFRPEDESCGCHLFALLTDYFLCCIRLTKKVANTSQS